MQISLNQAEIQEAVSAYIEERVAIQPGHAITVTFKATRGDEGATAIIDIVSAEDTLPFETEQPTPEPEAPRTRKPRETKHRMVEAKEDKPEVKDPEPEAAPAQEDKVVEPTEALKEAATEQAQEAEPEVATQEAEVAAEVQTEAVVEAPKKPSLFGNLKR